MISVQRSSWCRFVCLGLSVLLLYTLIAPQAVNAQTQRKRVIKISPGDAIHLSVYDGHAATEKSRFISNFHEKDFIIDDHGEIYLYALGKMRVAGLGTEEISLLLVEKFKRYAKDPIVMVEPKIRIALTGSFKEPGMYRFTLGTSFWDMVKTAGGLDGTSLEKVYLIRNGKRMSKNLLQAFYNASSIDELGLRSGDVIYAKRPRKISVDQAFRVLQLGLSVLLLYYTIDDRKNN